MSKTNFDLFLEEQLRDPDFAERFKRGRHGMWLCNWQLCARRLVCRKRNSRANSKPPSNKSADLSRLVMRVIL